MKQWQRSTVGISRTHGAYTAVAHRTLSGWEGGVVLTADLAPDARPTGFYSSNLEHLKRLLGKRLNDVATAGSVEAFVAASTARRIATAREAVADAEAELAKARAHLAALEASLNG